MAGERLSLSKRLYEIPVDDLVRTKNAPVVYPDARVQEARRLIRDLGLRSIPVVDRSTGKLVGVITRGDVLMVSSSKTEATVGALASMPPVVIRSGTGLAEALESMISNDQWDAPIVDDYGKLIKTFDLADFLAYALNNYQEALKRTKVEEVMSRDVVYARPSDFVSRIWHLMVELRYAGFPVVDDSGRVIGMITQYDLLAKGYSRIHLESESGPSRGPKVSDVMNRPATVVYPWTDLYEAASLMVNRGYGRIPVISSAREPKIVGIIDREDVVRSLL